MGHREGSSGDLVAGGDYVRAVERAGALPVLLPPLASGGEAASAFLRLVDGLLLAGGGDVDPQYFEEEPVAQLGQVDPERDLLELALAREALAERVPVLGICRGIQVLNVAAGGSLYQDIPSQVRGAFQHYQRAPRWHGTHTVHLEPGSQVARILGVEELRVNSFHHQSVKMVAPGFRVSAKSRDTVVEAIESKAHPFALGVQWHPEGMIDRQPAALRLFRALVEAAAEARLTRAAARPAAGEAARAVV